MEQLKTNIRNFVIISHIDHGKSTLADRFLELTATVPKEKMQSQYLDSMSLEKEKGITIKMHPVRMEYCFKEQEYVLNLIDTPGHIDFSYETSRALACVEGGILLVDAVKGLQAQTLFNLEQAQAQWGSKKFLIGAVNKIDLPFAEIEKNRMELARILEQKQEDVFLISAKTGENVKNLLEEVIRRLPAPSIQLENSSAKALVFDSRYDYFSGVVAYVRVFCGEIRKGDKIFFLKKNVCTEVREVGYFTPFLKPVLKLEAGEIGYIKTKIKDAASVRVGDTAVVVKNEKIKIDKQEALAGYREPQPVLFISLYPQNSKDFDLLKAGLEKLRLSDPALDFHYEFKTLLGRGIKVGFLGELQAEITIRRLKEEFGLDIISSVPQVAFKVITDGGREVDVFTPKDWPENKIKEAFEPYVRLEIITPNSFLGRVLKLLEKNRLSAEKTESLGAEKCIIELQAPLRKIVSGVFYDELKSATNGYASFSYQPAGFKPADLVKMDILILGKKEEAFSKIVPKEEAFLTGRSFIRKLKEILPPQQFSLPLQASVGGKIIARETIKARRKNVTAPLYGGDVTRKKKLLEIQKKGKKKMKDRASIKIPAQVYLKALKF